MPFKPRIWYPIAALAAVANVIAAGFAAAATEPVHAGTPAALALAFGLWAQHLRSRREESTGEHATGELESGVQAGLDALDAEVSRLRQELVETQERVDFTERMVASGPEKRGVDPQR